MIQNVSFVPGLFQRLPKDDLEVLAKQVVDFVAQKDADSMQIKFVYDELVKAHAQLHLTKVKPGRHPLTSDVVLLKKDRAKLIRAIIALLKVLNSTSKLYSIPQLNEVTEFVVRYLMPLTGAKSSFQTNWLNKMFEELQESVELQAAIEALSMKALFDELAVMNESFQNLEVERVDSRIRKVVDTHVVRKATEKALNNMIKDVELAQLKYPELDYSEIVTKMNEYILMRISIVKARSTARKNTKRRKGENVESIENTTAATMTANQGEAADIL